MEKRNYIVIISDIYDVTTNKVIEYLRYYGHYKILRINSGDNLFIKAEIGKTLKLQIQLKSKCIDIDFDSGISFWYRRGDVFLPVLGNPNYISSEFNQEIDTYLIREWHVMRNYFYKLVERRTGIIVSLGSFLKEIDNNKLYNLYTAKEVGFKVPETILASDLSDLIKFKREGKEYISKPLTFPPSISVSSQNYYSTKGTAFVTEDYFINSAKTIFPTFMQEYIDKQFEIRVFFIKGDIYSMAIFSQSDNRTKVDYRNYNFEKPNRTIPYKLPGSVAKRVRNFMEKIELDTGSLDIIYSKTKEYYFLEVNPHGQLDWLSYNCNYYLEKKISTLLLHGKN